MLALPEAIVALVGALNRLPGIGPRSAERIALYLAQSDPASVKHLAEALVTAREKIGFCTTCGALTESSPCPVCGDSRRDNGTLCIVERAVDVITLEKSGAFRGRYHVLGGKLSPLDGIEPEDLRIAELENRLKDPVITEIVIALPTDVEGDATSSYLAKRLARPKLKITRIAHGLPAGTGLELADDLTLTRALEGRRDMGR